MDSEHVLRCKHCKSEFPSVIARWTEVSRHYGWAEAQVEYDLDQAELELENNFDFDDCVNNGYVVDGEEEFDYTDEQRYICEECGAEHDELEDLLELYNPATGESTVDAPEGGAHETHVHADTNVRIVTAPADDLDQLLNEIQSIKTRS